MEQVNPRLGGRATVTCPGGPEFVRRVNELADLVASADLIADVDSSVPGIVIPPRLGRVASEALTYAFQSLGIEELLAELPSLRWPTEEASADWAEHAAAILCDWLRDHGVPKLHLWIPSRVARDFVSIEWTASA